MDLEKLDKKIEKNQAYKLFKKHHKLFVVIEGIIIIGLLLGVVSYYINDFKIKDQIRNHCGYTTNDFSCVCTKEAVDLFITGDINFSEINDGEIKTKDVKIHR